MGYLLNRKSPSIVGLKFAYAPFIASSSAVYPQFKLSYGSAVSNPIRSGILGNHLYLPGGSDNSYARVDNPGYLKLDTTKGFAFSTWFTLPAVPTTTWDSLFGLTIDNNNYYIFYLTVSTTSYVLGLWFYTSGSARQESYLTTGFSWTANKLYHLVLNWNPDLTDTQRNRTWINGAEVTLDSRGGSGDDSFTPTTFTLGGNAVWPEENSNAIFHEFRMYDRTLSNADIRRLYDRQTRFDIYEKVAPKLYWQLGIPVSEEGETTSQSLSAFGAGKSTSDQSLSIYASGGLQVNQSLSAYASGAISGLWPFTDNFTGNNGDPWDSQKWTVS